MSLRDSILYEVRRKAGLNEGEIAVNILGRDAAYQQRVNKHCRALVDEGKIIRQGKGGSADPFTYHLPPIVVTRRKL